METLEQLCADCSKPLLAGSSGGMCPHCLLNLGVEATKTSPAPAPTSEASPRDLALVADSPPIPAALISSEQAGDRVGRYKLLEQIGEGGFGTVWMAEQQEPVRRRVALKIIKLGMDTRAVVARFEAERQALALMDHQNIARVFDGGATEAGRPYFVMELVRGIPLTAYCDACKLNTLERLELFIPVCQAVQHAHQKGIIHRDLKPSNILVTEQDGRPIPKVIDFGIAKATSAVLTDKTLFTQFNQLLGTPAYMSPEQAGLGSLDIDTRSDIYSLGVLLYELLTSRTPLDPPKLRGAGYEAMLKTIREVEPPKPSTCLSTLKLEDLVAVAGLRREAPQQLNQRIRGDLDWIVLKALEKDRTRRYESANGLAADLHRYLNNELVTAAPPTLAYQLAKFARRQRPLLATAVAFLLLLVAGLVATGWQAVRAARHLKQARLNAYASEIKLAQQALSENNLGRAAELLERQRPKPGEDDLRGFEWRYLWQLARPNELETIRDGGPSQAVAFSPDGRLFATATTNITVRETASRRVVARLPGAAPSLAFSTQAKILAAGEPGQVRLWSTETWGEVRQLKGVAFPVRFSPDGAWMLTGAAAGHEPKHRLWRTDTWEVVAACAATPELSWQLRNASAFSPDGSLLVTPWLQTTNGVCGLKLWKVPTLELVEDIFLGELTAWSAAFLPDGQHLVMGTFNGELVVWDIRRRAIVQVIKENNSGITTVSVTPRADIFATASHDHRVSLWDSKTLKVLTRFRGHVATIWASALSPDGRLVATGSFDGTTKLWDATAPGTADSFEAGSLIAGFTRNGGTLVLAPREGDYRWHLFGPTHSTVEVSADPPLRWDYIHRPYDAFGDIPVGVLGRTDGSVELWDLATGRRTVSWRADTNAITAASFSPDGTRLATGNAKGQIRVWHVSTRQELAMFQLAGASGVVGPVAKLAFSPDGQNLAGGCWPSGAEGVVVWNLASRRQVLSLSDPGGNGNVTTIAFSPDGRLLACGRMGLSDVQIWDLPSGRRRNPLKGHVTGIVEIAFSPDGRTLATGGYDTVKLWNLATEQEVASLPYRGTFRSLRFSPDGRTLAAGYLTFPGHRVRIYAAPSLEEITKAEQEAEVTSQQ